MIEPLIQASLGGLLLNVVNLYADYRKPKALRVDKDALYFFFFAVWPIAGAILAYIYISSGYRIDGMLAFTLGLTAPTTLEAMIAKVVRSDEPPPNSEP